MKAVSDEICRQYQKSVIASKAGKGLPYPLAKGERNGMPSRLNLAKAALDEALLRCGNLRELEQHLKQQGYILSIDSERTYWTIRQPDWKRPIWLIRMGDGYSRENITRRLIGNQAKSRIDMRELQATIRREHVQKRARPRRKVSGLRGRYLHYCYRLGVFRKHQNPRRIHYLYRDDLLKLHNITAETRLLCENRMESAEELFSYQEKLEREVKNLCAQRKGIYNEFRRRETTPKRKEELTAERERLTKEIRKCKREQHLCGHILLRAESMKKTMDKEKELREQMRRKERERERGCER